MDNKELYKQLALPFAGIIIGVIVIVFSINSIVTKSVDHVKEVGLKNIIEEIWEGKQIKK